MLTLTGAEVAPAALHTDGQSTSVLMVAPVPQKSLTVTLTPAGAVAAGAQWRLVGETVWRDSGVAYTDLATGLHFVEFKPISGWIEPREDRVMRIIEGVVQVLSPAEYQPVPRFPVAVTSSQGGTVVSQVWQPMGPSAVHPMAVDGSDESLNREWESLLRNPRSAPRMPAENAGARMRLHALPYPGYRFVGWIGGATGTRNPLTFIVNSPRTIRAAFEKAAPWIVASHAADTYASPGCVTIHCQFNYTPGDQLQSLVWRPKLPAGWRLAGVTGLGRPMFRQDEVQFAGPLGANPILFNLNIEVPSGQVGDKAFAATVEYRLAGEDAPTARPVGTLHPFIDTVLKPGISPAARLELDASTGRPILTLHGEVGRTYAIEQVPSMFTNPPLRRFWWFLTDVTVTNSSQSIPIDAVLTSGMSTFYRAVLVE